MTAAPPTTVPTTPPSAWRTAIDDYLMHLRLDLRRAPGTIRLRRHHLVRLRTWLGTASPWEVTSAQLRDWMRSHEHWRPESRKSALSTIRGFYAWGVLHEHTAADPTRRLPAISIPRGLPRPVPDHQIRTALEGATDRERLMVLLGAEGGLRAHEMAAVHRDDLDGDILMVKGKGSHHRAVPVLNSEVLAAIRSADGWLFPNGLGSHLSAGHVTKLVSQLLPGHWTAHSLRHRAGTASYSATQDVRAVQELLGHANITTTQRYVAVSNAGLRRAAAGAAGLLGGTA